MVISDDEKKNMIRNWYSDEDEKYIASVGEEYEQRFSETKKTGGGCAILTTKNCYLQGEYSAQTGKKAQQIQIDKTIPISKISKCKVRYSWYSLILKLTPAIAVIVFGFLLFQNNVITEYGIGIDTNLRQIDECESEIENALSVSREFSDMGTLCIEEGLQLVKQLRETGLNTPGVTYKYSDSYYSNDSGPYYGIAVRYSSPCLGTTVSIGGVTQNDSALFGTSTGDYSLKSFENILKQAIWNDEYEVMKAYYSALVSYIDNRIRDEYTNYYTYLDSNLYDNYYEYIYSSVSSKDEFIDAIEYFNDEMSKYADELQLLIDEEENKIRNEKRSELIVQVIGIGIILLGMITGILIGIKVKLTPYLYLSYITDELDVKEIYLVVDKKRKKEARQYTRKVRYLRENKEY